MFWNTLYATTTAGLVAGPQSPRITNRMAYNNYQRCARFSLIVLQACMGQSNGDPRKQRSCRQHYQGNIVRCQRRAS